MCLSSCRLQSTGLSLECFRVLDCPRRNRTWPTRDQSAHAVGKVGNLRRRPSIADPVNERCRERVARSDCVRNVNLIDVRLAILIADEQYTTFCAARYANGLPTKRLGVTSAEFFHRIA